jgi:hypothetical protein
MNKTCKRQLKAQSKLTALSALKTTQTDLKEGQDSKLQLQKKENRGLQTS